MTATLAVVGVDGSGKSTAVAHLRDRLGAGSGLATLHCPRYHDMADAPLAQLSRDLDALSVAADGLALRHVKAAALYLQMTLYGPVVRRLTRTLGPRCLVSDRHPIVDTLAYGPLYTRMLTGERPAAACDALRARLARRRPGAFERVQAWHRRVTGHDQPLADLACDVARIFAAPVGQVLDELGRRYRTRAPDVVVLLDVDPTVASTRLAGRGGRGSELHERVEALTTLRALYEGALDALRTERPEIDVHRLDATALSVEETVDALLDRLPPAAFTPRSAHTPAARDRAR